MIIHLVETYGDRFKSIETFGVVEQLNKRYAQYHDTSVVAATSADTPDRHIPITTTLTLYRYQQPNGVDRWATGIKEMDSVEEDYFNGDEEEEIPPGALPVDPVEEVSPEKPFELKRRRSANDDGDDELLQLSQRLPAAKGMLTSFTDAHLHSLGRFQWN